MFRPTHFVILFAFFLCVYAAPAAEPAEASGPNLKEAIPDPKVEGEPAKGDLEADPATYWRYMYNYGPRFKTYSERSHGWGFGKQYDGWEPHVVFH